MYNFVLCDDNERHNVLMAKRLKKIIFDKELDAQVAYSTTRVEDILNYSKKNKLYNNIYILDIDLKSSINGIDLAKNIRINEPMAYIIYVSAHQEYSILGYKTKTFDFLVKPVQEHTLKECVHNLFNDIMAVQNNDDQGPALSIRSGANIYSLEIKDLIYCEKFGNIAVFHTKNSIIKSYDSLESLEEKLEQYGFYRCHNSFLINLNFIDHLALDKQMVYMKNGDTCNISRRMRKGLVDYVKQHIN